MTTCYLGYSPTASHTLIKHAKDEPVNLLVAFPDLKKFEADRSKFNINRWVLDSGAFSVWNSGKTIDLGEYIETCKRVDAAEVFGLDVIGEPHGTRDNLERMWSEGVQAIPTHHYGAPWEQLEWAAANAPKIALGGMAKRRGGKVNKWVLQCFARVWPKPIHAFGWARWEAFKLAPFHSCDAVSWCLSPSKFGNWAGYTGRQMPVRARGVKDMWIEIEEHQKRERWAQFRWRRELELLKNQLEGQDGKK